jgi:hypothetical protein
VLLEGLGDMENSGTSGIEPAANFVCLIYRRVPVHCYHKTYCGTLGV